MNKKKIKISTFNLIKTPQNLKINIIMNKKKLK